MKKKLKVLSDVNFVLMSQNLFVAQMEEIIKILVFVHAEETAKNTAKVNALKKRAVPDVLECYNLSAVKKELLMITCAI